MLLPPILSSQLNPLNQLLLFQNRKPHQLHKKKKKTVSEKNIEIIHINEMPSLRFLLVLILSGTIFATAPYDARQKYFGAWNLESEENASSVTGNIDYRDR